MRENNQEQCKEAILSNDYADFFVREEITQSVVAGLDVVCVQSILDKYNIIQVPITNREELQSYNIAYSAFPKLYGLMDTNNMEDIGVNRIRRLEYLDLLGQGVLIGFVDTGIDYTLEIFKNSQNTSRIASIWDQTIQTGTPPETMYYGTEFTQEEINTALRLYEPRELVPTTDENGHGTFVAGIAAGNIDSQNDFTGVAPQAEIVMVKLKEAKEYLKDYYYVRQDAVAYQETDILMGIKYLVNVAREKAKPMVICLSLGTNAGGHNGESILSEYLTRIGDFAGVAVITPTGNEANYNLHYRGREINIDTYEDVEIRVGENERGFSMEFWAQSPSVFSIGIISPSGEIIDRIPARIENSQVLQFVFEQTVVYLDYRLLEVRTGDQLIFLRFQAPTAGIWTLRVYKETNFNNYYDIWLPIREFIGPNTYFLRPDPDVTITDPGNTRLPITVGAYDHTNKSIYLNSGRGYTRNGNVKPDIAAPGVNVYGPAQNNTFVVRSGTSVAAAHAAGVAALLLQWGVVDGNRPQMDTIDIKSLMVKGAERSNLIYPNNVWGYGSLNIYGAFNSLRISV